MGTPARLRPVPIGSNRISSKVMPRSTLARALVASTLLILKATAQAPPATKSQTVNQTTVGEAPKYPPGLYAVINTSVGVITAQLFEKETPVTVRNFIG